jgi:hypothetical protein
MRLWEVRQTRVVQLRRIVQPVEEYCAVWSAILRTYTSTCSLVKFNFHLAELRRMGRDWRTHHPCWKKKERKRILIENNVEVFCLLEFLLKSANFVFSFLCTASCCHRSLCMSVVFRFLVSHLLASSFTSDSISVSMPGFRRQTSAALKP